LQSSSRVDDFTFISLARLTFNDKEKDVLLHAFSEKRTMGTSIGILEATMACKKIILDGQFI
jgi:hypothetical protein